MQYGGLGAPFPPQGGQSDGSGDAEEDGEEDEEEEDGGGGGGEQRQSMRQAIRMERSMARMASAARMPRDESAAELDVVAVTQVLLHAAEALRRAERGQGAAAPLPAGRAAEERRLVPLGFAAAASNAATLVRPERLVMGLAQTVRIFCHGSHVDPDSPAYALDAFAPTIKASGGEARAYTGPGDAAESSRADVVKVCGVPALLACGDTVAPAGSPAPPSASGQGVVGSYVAIDWSARGSSRWFGGVIRAAVLLPDGPRHVVDYDDGETYMERLDRVPHVIVARAGTFGLEPGDAASAEADVPTPGPADIPAGSTSHKLGNRGGRGGPMQTLRRRVAAALRAAAGGSTSYRRHGGGAYGYGGPAQAASAPKRVRRLEYDILGAEVPSEDEAWALAALGRGAVDEAWAHTGFSAAGPLLCAGPTVVAPAEGDVAPGQAAGSAAGGAAPPLASMVSALDVADAIEAAGGAAPAAASLPGPADDVPAAAAAAAADTDADGEAGEPADGSLRVTLPLEALVSEARVFAVARSRLGLAEGMALACAPGSVRVTVEVGPAEPRAEDVPATDGSDEAESTAAGGVLLAGGAGAVTAFARATAVARAGRGLLRHVHSPVLVEPSVTAVDVLVNGLGSADGAGHAPGTVRTAAGATAAGRREVSAILAGVPWMFAGSGRRSAGDALAALSATASLASELSSAALPTFSDGRALAGSLSSSVLDPASLLVPRAASAFRAQLADNVAMAFGCVPAWLASVASVTPFAVPHALRRRLFFFTAFGPTRRILAVQDELGRGRPGDSEAKAAARARARDNDPERILPVTVKAVASRSSVLRSARAIFRWWCAPLQRHQRALALVRRARLLCHVRGAATVPTSAPVSGPGGSERVAFRESLPSGGLSSAGMAAAMAQGLVPPGYGAPSGGGGGRASAGDTPFQSSPGGLATPRELRLPAPPPGCDTLGRRKGSLNVSFAGEEAHGAGVTREFYTLVFRQLQLLRLGLWRDTPQEDAAAEDREEHQAAAAFAGRRFAFAPHGLFPAALPAAADDAARVLDLFVLAGRAAAKALEDGHRDIDLPVSEAFAKLVLEAPLALRDVPQVDPGMEATVRVLEDLVRALDEADALEDDALRAWAAEQCDALCLTWTIGAAELVPGGDDLPVTADNVRAFCRAVVHRLLVRPAALQARAFRHGFACVADVSALRLLEPSELVSLLTDSHGDGGVWQDHLWAADAIRASLTFHSSDQFRFRRDDPAVTAFCRALEALSPRERRLFLEFATASPRLPDEGFAGLRPRRLQVNRRVPRPGRTPDDEPIFCRVCTSELSLPEYSSPDVLRSRLLEAIGSVADGLGGFRKNA